MKSKAIRNKMTFSTVCVLVGGIFLLQGIYPFAIYCIGTNRLPAFLAYQSNHINIAVIFISGWLMALGFFWQSENKNVLRGVSLLFLSFWAIWYLMRLKVQASFPGRGYLNFQFPEGRFDRMLFCVEIAVAFWIVSPMPFFTRKWNLFDKLRKFRDLGGSLYDKYMRAEGKILSRSYLLYFGLIAIFALGATSLIDYDKLLTLNKLSDIPTQTQHYFYGRKKINEAHGVAISEDSKRVVIIGASYAYLVRAESINDSLKEKGLDCKLFNFGVQGAFIEVEKLLTDLTSELDPDLALFLLTARDFKRVDAENRKTAERILFNADKLLDMMPSFVPKSGILDNLLKFYIL